MKFTLPAQRANLLRLKWHRVNGNRKNRKNLGNSIMFWYNKQVCKKQWGCLRTSFNYLSNFKVLQKWLQIFQTSLFSGDLKKTSGYRLKFCIQLRPNCPKSLEYFLLLWTTYCAFNWLFNKGILQPCRPSATFFNHFA
jgi:hypothetical protein